MDQCMCLLDLFIFFCTIGSFDYAASAIGDDRICRLVVGFFILEIHILVFDTAMRVAPPPAEDLHTS